MWLNAFDLVAIDPDSNPEGRFTLYTRPLSADGHRRWVDEGWTTECRICGRRVLTATQPDGVREADCACGATIRHIRPAPQVPPGVA